jgi:hypothetical protein
MQYSLMKVYDSMQEHTVSIFSTEEWKVCNILTHYTQRHVIEKSSRGENVKYR